MSETFRCPRGDSPPIFDPTVEGEDTWRPERGPYHMGPTCSYCGSITPDALFAAIEAGHEIEPTDKSYKLYVTVPSPDPSALRVSGGSSGDERPDWGKPECWHRYDDLSDEQRTMLARDGWTVKDQGWVLIDAVGDTQHGKFYFQHLDSAGRDRFIALVNDGKINFGYPGHLYSRPYFARPTA